MWYATAVERKDYSYRAFADEIDTILKELIQYDIALEINTGGYKAGLGVPNPTPDVIRRYRELGGEKITLRCRCPQTGTYSVSFRGRGSYRAGSRIPVLRAV